VVTRSRISVYWRAKKAGEKLNRESLPGNEDISVVEQIPDPASDALDEVWQREWQENLMNTAMRRVRSKVASQQLLIFRTTALGRLSSGQVAKKLGVSLAQVYLARHRMGRLLKAQVQRLQRIKRSLNPQGPVEAEIVNSASTKKGFSLPQVADLSRKIRLNYQMAFREKAGAFVVQASSC
jgi:hypothetical protein